MENGREAREIIRLLSATEGARQAVLDCCGEPAVAFIEDMVERSNAVITHWHVTGKQLFWLRDIKDKLVEKGII